MNSIQMPCTLTSSSHLVLLFNLKAGETTGMASYVWDLTLHSYKLSKFSGVNPQI